MEQLEPDINFSTEDMDSIDFTSVEPSVSSCPHPPFFRCSYTSGPVLDLQEYPTPLSPTMPLGGLGDDSDVLPHDTTPDDFDTPTSLPVSVVVGPSVDSISITTADVDDNPTLDMNPLLLPSISTCELGGNLPHGSDLNSDCENALNKELILENIPRLAREVGLQQQQTVENNHDGIKETSPNISPVQINLPNFPNINNNIVQLSTPGPNVILASPTCMIQRPRTNTETNIPNSKNIPKTPKPISDTVQVNNLISIDNTQSTTVGNVIERQEIRVEFNKISPETTIVKLCFAPQNGAGPKQLNQNLTLNQEVLATLIAGSNSILNVSKIDDVMKENHSDNVENNAKTLKDSIEDVPETSEDLNPSDDEDDKPLQQLKEEMAFALQSDLVKENMDISEKTSQTTHDPVDITSMTQTNESEATEQTDANLTEPNPEVEISSLLSDIKNMKTLAKLDEISIQINEGQYREVSGKMRWCCGTCDKSYTTKHNLIIHTLGHHGIKPHVCSVCKRMFSQRSHLKTHILTHGNIKPHVCHICNRSFTQLSHVKRHICTHMEKRPYHCDLCDRGFAYPSELKAHKLKHERDKDHQCDQCTAAFNDAKKLAFHKKTIHKDPGELTCKECGREYSYPSQLKEHMVKHTGMRPYSCDECGMDFMKEHHLRSHMYTHSGMKPWQCAVCSRTFNQKANMMRHMLIHETTRKYECDVCYKTFSQPQTLKAHRVVHSDKKPYTCQVCGKDFGRLHTLQGHMHVHLDSRPHVCFCGASFTLKGNLTRHKKVKHDIADPNQCTEEEAAKILEIMSTKRRGTGGKLEDGKDAEDTEKNSSDTTGEESVSPSTTEIASKGNCKDLETLTSLKPNCNDATSLLVLDSSPMVDSFHSYCAKDTTICDNY